MHIMESPTTDLPLAPAAPPWPATLLVAAILLAWLAAIAALAGAGAFEQPDALVPWRILPFAGLPPLLFLLAHRSLPAVRAWVAGLDLAVVVGLQAWRVIGIVFLAYWATGLLPAVFAWPAGLGDIAVGALGIAAALRVARQAPGWEGRVRALVAWGLADFVLAFSAAILANPGLPLHFDGAPAPAMVVALPLALISAYGVPLFAILHLIAWLRLPARG